jgi:hypothetical protein
MWMFQGPTPQRCGVVVDSGIAGQSVTGSSRSANRVSRATFPAPLEVRPLPPPALPIGRRQFFLVRLPLIKRARYFGAAFVSLA